MLMTLRRVPLDGVEQTDLAGIALGDPDGFLGIESDPVGCAVPAVGLLGRLAARVQFVGGTAQSRRCCHAVFVRFQYGNAEALEARFGNSDESFGADREPEGTRARLRSGCPWA
jgi:hypothetical protein